MNQKEYEEYIEKWKEENKELIDSGKCRKVFTEILPYKITKDGKYNIQWNKSLNYTVHFIYNKIEDNLKIIDYDKGKLTIYNNKYNKFNIGCSKLKIARLGTWLKEITKDFKLSIGENIFDNKRDLVILDKKNGLELTGKESNKKFKYYKYRCLKCGYKGYMTEYNLLKHHTGCACCSSKVIVKDINSIYAKNKNLIKYFINIEDTYKYGHASNVKVKMKCPYCGFEKYRTPNDLYSKGFSCPRCGDGISYPNKFMFNLLHQLNIEFKSEYSPNWIGNMRYDFYIPSKQLIIEMDGAFHYRDNKMNGQTVNKSQEIDNYKDLKAKEHNIEVIRIDCNYEHDSRFKYIKNNILHSRLSEIFNLNNINWLEINNKSEESIVIKMGKYWNDNDTCVKDMTIIFNSNKSFITKALKTCDEIGICNYNPKLEIDKSRKKYKGNGRPVMVFKNKKLVYFSETVTNLNKKSLKIFNIYFSNYGLLKALKENKQYKGYYFKYGTKEEYEEYIKNKDL